MWLVFHLHLFKDNISYDVFVSKLICFLLQLNAFCLQYLDYSWEKFYRKWDNGSHVLLSYASSKWIVEIRWINNRCVFANGWVAFAKETGLEAGDYLLLHKSPKKEFQTLNICIFKAKDCRPSSDDGMYFFSFLLKILIS